MHFDHAETEAIPAQIHRQGRSLRGPTRRPWSIPRGNGKSHLAAHILARALTPGDPFNVPGAECLLGAASIEQALADEAGTPRGQLLPFASQDGMDKTLTDLRGDLNNLAGGLAVVEDMNTVHQDVVTPGSSLANWQPRRLGANPPAGLVQLAEQATREVWAACGISPAVFAGADRTAAREAWRQSLFGTIAPLGRIIVAELREKIDPSISLSWDELRASDLSGRARAFQSTLPDGTPTCAAARWDTHLRCQRCQMGYPPESPEGVPRRTRQRRERKAEEDRRKRGAALVPGPHAVPTRARVAGDGAAGLAKRLRRPRVPSEAA